MSANYHTMITYLIVIEMFMHFFCIISIILIMLIHNKIMSHNVKITFAQIHVTQYCITVSLASSVM